MQGSRVEIVSERSESSSTFANPDGTLTVEASAGPVRFRDAAAAGGWRDIDVSLVQAGDGSVRAKSFPGGLELAGPGGAAGQVRDLVRTGGADGVGLRWRGVLPRPSVAGTRATYVDVLPGTVWWWRRQ